MFRWARRESVRGDPFLAAQALLLHGDLEEAARLHEQTIKSHRVSARYEQAADLGLDVGLKFSRAGSHEMACSFLEGAIRDYYLSTKEPFHEGVPKGVLIETGLLNVGECRFHLGVSQSKLERYPQALRSLRKAAVKFRSSNVEIRAGDSYLMWGAALRDYGFKTNRDRLLRMALAKFEMATKMYAEAESIRLGCAGVSPGQVFLSSADVYVHFGEYDRVILAYPKAKSVFDKFGNKQQRQWCEGTYRDALQAKAHAGLNLTPRIR